MRTAQMTGILLVLATPISALADTHVKHGGEAAYMRSCVACHGSDGAGTMPGIPDLGGTDTPLNKSDAVLLSSIMKGVESENAPLPMPPKGGDDALSKAEARQVIDYMRRAFGAQAKVNM